MILPHFGVHRAGVDGARLGLFARSMAVVMQMVIHASSFVDLPRFLTLPSWKGQVPFTSHVRPTFGWLLAQGLAVLDIDLIVTLPYLERPLRLDP